MKGDQNEEFLTVDFGLLILTSAPSGGQGNQKPAQSGTGPSASRTVGAGAPSDKGQHAGGFPRLQDIGDGTGGLGCRPL